MVQRGVLSDNGENLDFDDPLNEIARFLRSQGLQHEVQIDPKTIKREERREKGRENREGTSFGGKSHRSSKLSAFQRGAGAETGASVDGNALGSGAHYPLRKQLAANRQHAKYER